MKNVSSQDFEKFGVVGTDVTTYPIVNPMKIAAYFAYNPSYTVTVNFTVYFDLCSSTMIVP